MKRFYDDIDQLHQFTLERGTASLPRVCVNCNKNNTLVSHGFVYKQQNSHARVPIAKRLFCSNRYGQPGCGRTIQLYLSDWVPGLHHSSKQVSGFIRALINGSTILQAYQEATSKQEARNAYRWLTKLVRQLPTLRSLSRKIPQSLGDHYQSRCLRLQLLLPTLNLILEQAQQGICTHYQQSQQHAFI